MHGVVGPLFADGVEDGGGHAKVLVHAGGAEAVPAVHGFPQGLGVGADLLGQPLDGVG